MTGDAFPSSGRAAYGLIVLVLLGFVLTTDMTLTAILIEPMKRELRLTDVQVALLQGTAFGLALGVASLPMGRLIDQVSRRLLIAVGLFAWTGALAAIGLAGSVSTLVVARAVLGVVAALVVPAAFSMAADLYPAERRSVATSLLVAGQALGQGFGMLAGGIAFDALTRQAATGLPSPFAPWRILYLVAALLGLVLLILLVFLREPARQERREAGTTALAAARGLWAFRHFLIPLMLGLLFAQITIQAASIWAAPLLIRRGVTPGGFAGWMSAVLLGGGIVGSLAGGWLAEWGRRRAGRMGVMLPATLFAVAIAPASLFAVVHPLPLFAMLLTIDVFAGAVVATIGVIAVTLVIPNEVRGLALASNTFAAAIFGAAGAPLLVALLSRSLGGEAWLGVAFACICVPSACLAALFLASTALGGGVLSRSSASSVPRCFADGVAPDASV